MPPFLLEGLAFAGGLEPVHWIGVEIPGRAERPDMVVGRQLPLEEFLHRDMGAGEDVCLPAARLAEVADGDKDLTLEGLDGHTLFGVAASGALAADCAPAVHVQTGGDLRIHGTNAYVTMAYDDATDRFTITRFKAGFTPKTTTFNFA